MKSILILTLVLAISVIQAKDKWVERDTQPDQPLIFDFTQLNTKDLGMLVDVVTKVFPKVSQLGDRDFKLGETTRGCFDMFGILFCWDFTWEAYLGWTVKPMAIDYSSQMKFIITYVPYAKVVIGSGLKGSSFLFQGEFRSQTIIFSSEFPMTAQYDFNVKQLCYKADLLFYNPSAEVYVQSSVKECMQDIEKAGRTGQFVWNCNFNSPLKITLFNNTGVATVNNVVPRTCWTL